MIHTRLTYANVVSTLCLFLLLGGATAYAANTVFSTDIVDGQVKTVDLANGAVSVTKLADGSITGDKIKDESIQSRDVLDNNLKGADIDESTLSNIGGGGPAGGDLEGTYPDPAIGADAVTGAEIADSSITGADVGLNALTAADLAGFGAIESSFSGAEDLVGGGPKDVVLVDSPQFGIELIGRCEETSTGVVRARVFYIAQGSPDELVNSVDSTAPGGINDAPAIPAGSLATLLSLGPTSGEHVADGTFSIFRWDLPSNTSLGALYGSVAATTHVAEADCAFRVSMFA